MAEQAGAAQAAGGRLGSVPTRATLLAVSSLTVMAGAAIAPSLPGLREHYEGVANADLLVRLVLTLPGLLIALCAPLAGWMVDRFGRRPLLVGSVALYGLAGGSGLVVDSIGAMLAGRMLLGIAVAGVMTGATTLATDYYAGTERARFLSWQAAAMAGGGAVFLLGGGVLAELHWRLPFLTYLAAWAFLPLVVAYLPEPARASPAGNAPGAGDPPVPSSTRLLVLLYALGFTGMAAYYVVPVQVPFLLRELAGSTPSASGAALAAATLVGAASSLAYGRVRTRLGAVATMSLCLGLIGAGFALVFAARGYGTALAALAVCGLGGGLLLPNLNVWLAAEVPPRLRGRALGGLTAAIFMGQFASPLLTQPVATALGGIGELFGVTGALLLAVAAGLALGRRRIARFTGCLSRVPGAPGRGARRALRPLPAGEIPGG
jgi:MFS family permease